MSGVTHGRRQEALERLTRHNPEDITFTLSREPDNQYDPDAVAVTVSVSGSRPYTIGYVPAVTAPLVSAILRNGTGIKARLRAIVGGYAPWIRYGLRLCVSL